MSDLVTESCEACRADAPKVSDEELAELIKEIPNWQPITEDNILRLRRTFEFKDYLFKNNAKILFPERNIDSLYFDNFKGVKINANKNPMSIAVIDTAIVISVAINNSSPHPLSPK